MAKIGEKIGDVLRDFRSRNRLSQGELASRLKVSQSLISNIERGLTRSLPQDLEERITKLLMQRSIGGLSPVPVRGESKLRTKNFREFSIGQIEAPFDKGSGDVVHVAKDKNSDLLNFIVLDAVGHGAASSLEASAILFGYLTALSSLPQVAISPTVIEQSISQAIIQSSIIKGPPSIGLGSLNMSTSEIFLVNSGNPPIYFFSKNSLTKVDHDPARPAIPLNSRIPHSTSINFLLEPGDTVMIHTDGIIQNIPDVEALFSRFAKRFRGDAKAMATNLKKIVDEKAQISDDSSALIISRAR